MQRSQTLKFRSARGLAALLVAAGAAGSLAGCGRPEPETALASRQTSPQQAIVERAAFAYSSMREKPEFAAMGSYLERARAVLIFPRVVKASVIFGGEGGNGVMVTRKPDGSWSDPAFYSLGAPSVGLQIGYQEATVVLFIMDDATVRRAMRSSLTLGTKAGVAVGHIGDRSATQSDVIAPRIYQVVEAGGVFAGVSLDGYVIGAREGHNDAYYGAGTSVRDILVDFDAHRPESRVLTDALKPGG